MDSNKATFTHQPLREILPDNLDAAMLPILSASKLPLPPSKLKVPTPSASFKRPALSLFDSQDNGAGSKKLRLDISSASSLEAASSKFTDKAASVRSNCLASKAKSMASVHHKPSRPMPRHTAPTQHAIPSRSSHVTKTPSMNIISSTKISSSSLVSAPTTKTGKRPAWDLKGRIQDTEDMLNAITIQNANLLKTTEIYNQRLALLESTNNKLSEEVKFKETLSTAKSNEVEALQVQLDHKSKHCVTLQAEMSILQGELVTAKSDLSCARQNNATLENTIATMSSIEVGLKAQLTATKLELDASACSNRQLNEEISLLKDQISQLQGNLLKQETKIREDEAVRRRLHNTIQELKGNIRVVCRVRPILSSDVSKSLPLSFPDDDHRSMEITKTSDIDGSTKNRPASKYTFDRVFDPACDQSTVFDEISQLVQSALDGYNVCIFAYGQTGSGKTFTMEGPIDVDSDKRGMIPRTVEQIFTSLRRLEAQGWQYSMEATFVEIYNETIRDLLGNACDKLVKHEIKMCDTKGTDVYVSNLNTVGIVSREQVYQLLARAQKNRAVAATLCNERSSRSHSVFRLSLNGKNSETLETCQGLLNLVDLAGSERLKESLSEGDRLKETKSINKSLSNLSTVIMSLANKNEHVPFRNSKLTHLLMNSLGGNSKTLMVVNVSPCEDHFNETINSLRFATTVNQCEIGTAQKKRMTK